MVGYIYLPGIIHHVVIINHTNQKKKIFFTIDLIRAIFLDISISMMLLLFSHLHSKHTFFETYNENDNFNLEPFSITFDFYLFYCNYQRRC